MKDFTTYQSSLLKSFFDTFMTMTRSDKYKVWISKDLKIVLEKSNMLKKVLQGVKGVGESLLQQAKWIGLDKSNEENRSTQLNVHMVEREDLQRRGLKSGALGKKDGDVLLLGKDWNCVCTPEEAQSGKTYALVFWD